MKKTALLLLLLPSIWMTACSDDDNSNVNDPQAAEGQWKLVNVSGSIAGTSHDFAPGTITWTFDEDANTVTVVNNNTNENAEDFFASGTYDFHFEANQNTPDMCAQSLFIENLELGCQTETATQLVLSQTWADGYQLTFVK
ncbi:hypothetical protein HYN59_14075 [Flavobacterium album]|uniref:Lipocalin-like domain-containing protein n=1 Tax=Flavobacterium album TaxID=2175091 RepID=A0A2S1R0L8_9FLAO|nr:hypothetical protein [Flavobacterium album]AWH86165.1 hypothetical protein HYN59_14075 [Flavobacterium album]